MSVLTDDCGNYYCCPNCGNNGEFGEFTISGTVYLNTSEECTATIREMYDETSYDDYEDVEHWGQIDSEIVDIELDGDYGCGFCGHEFNTFAVIDGDVFEDINRPSLQAKRNADKEKAKSRTKIREVKSKLQLHTGKPTDEMRQVLESVSTQGEMDDILRLESGADLAGYGVYPKGHDNATPETARLYEVCRELAVLGYYNHGSRANPPGYHIRMWSLNANLDEWVEFDSGDRTNHKAIRILASEINPMGDRVPVKDLFILVPQVEEPANGRADPDTTVYIAEMTIEIFEAAMNADGNCDMTNWTSEMIDRLTFYTCEREELGRTLEIVFDMTKDGYLPLIRKLNAA